VLVPDTILPSRMSVEKSNGRASKIEYEMIADGLAPPSEPTTHPHTSVAGVVEVTVRTNSMASRVARHRHVAQTDANGISHVQIPANKVDEKDGLQ
jgi:hypothetical protein